MTFEKLNIPDVQNLEEQFRPLQSKYNSDCHQSVFYIKKSIFFILIKKQNISNQSSLVIGHIGFLISSKLINLVDCLKAYGRFDF